MRATKALLSTARYRLTLRVNRAAKAAPPPLTPSGMLGLAPTARAIRRLPGLFFIFVAGGLPQGRSNHKDRTLDGWPSSKASGVVLVPKGRRSAFEALVVSLYLHPLERSTGRDQARIRGRFG